MAKLAKERATGGRRLPGWARRGLIALGALVVVAWALAPAARGVALVANRSNRVTPSPHAAGIPVREVHFSATDGVRLAGWLAIASPNSPTIILVHGFKSTRVSMLAWARFLYAADYNVLLYDSRGCGASAGWGIGLGASEPNDIIGAARYLAGLPGLSNKRIGALGVSLGAGDVILAAAREPRLLGIVADSPWADERPQLDRMGGLPLGPLAIPVLPYEPALVDSLIGARLEDASPARVAARIAPRALLVITSADDANATTAPADQARIFAAAKQPKSQWIAPSGGHAGAYYAHTSEYQQRVIAFFAQFVGLPANAVTAGA
ncbi:MAG TPA: CocE/NonD family hydrolase [Ktedonobacterales bacterium]